jgi:hypothetical protein
MANENTIRFDKLIDAQTALGLIYSYNTQNEKETETPVEVKFDSHAGERQTRTSPGEPAHTEVTTVTVNGREINVNSFGGWEEFTAELEQALASDAQDTAEYHGDAQRDRMRDDNRR